MRSWTALAVFSKLLYIVCKSESQREEDKRDKKQPQNFNLKQQKRQIVGQILQQL